MEDDLKINKKHMIIGIILLIVIVSAALFVFNSGKNTTINLINMDNEDLRVAEIDLPGMFCKACEYGSESTFKSLPGVIKADVSIKTKKGIVVYDSSIISKEQLIETSLIQSYDGSITSDEKYGEK